MAPPIKESMYKPGSVSAALFGKKKKNDTSDSFLTDLFSAPKCPPPFKYDVESHSTQKVVLKNGSTKIKNSQKSDTKKKLKTKPLASVKENIVVAQSVKSKKKVKQQTESTDIKIALPVKENKKQAQRKEANDHVSSSNDADDTTEFPFLHETLQKQSKSPQIPKSSPKKRKAETEDDAEEAAKRIRIRNHRHRDKTNDKRTIFIGNCSLNTDKKTLKRLFKEFGDIETLRFRCAPAAQLELPRRAVVITKDFHEQSKSLVSYIVFKEESAAEKALSMNGHLLDGLHLRVDLASQSKQHDKKKSIFLGNLPFDTKEEALRGHFDDCGEITNVRVIRDRRTSLGKGIAYVSFESKDSVNLALKLDNSEFKGRKMRVRVCTNNPEKIEERKAKTNPKSIHSGSSHQKEKEKEKEKKMSFAPSNMTTTTFSSVLKIKKDKRLRKIKKRKDNAKTKKSDGLSSIFGDVDNSKKQMKVKKNKRMDGKVKGKKKSWANKGASRRIKMRGSKKTSSSKSKKK